VLLGQDRAVGAPLSSSRGEVCALWSAILLVEVADHGSVHDGGEVSFQAAASFGWALSLSLFAGQVGAGVEVPSSLWREPF